MKERPLSIQVNGELMDFATPKVMGILNVTPDSFYAGSRAQTEKEIITRVQQILTEGADIIDVGAYSSRPGATDISVKEEMQRLRFAMHIIRQIAPKVIVSVDTFRADVATMCVEEYGANIINDISAGEMDNRMFDTVSRLNVPYVMMHMKGIPTNMQQNPQYDSLLKELFHYFAIRIDLLHQAGVKDIILDPGFGFGKTIQDNYLLLAWLHELHLFNLPILVGISRKSMIYNLLNCTPEEALNGTTILNTIALGEGAHILRVHDVKACKECIKLYEMVTKQKMAIVHE